jgi:2-polyprenyl-3-methyl-5-hydroxy-6-metoxy-1,4-benzoquinol methylase
MQGNQVHVISAGSPDALSEESLNGVNVHRVGGMISEKLRRWFKDEAPQPVVERSVTGESDKSFRNVMGALVQIVHDLTWKKFYWPESTCLWFFPARAKALKLIDDISFEAVISTSTPYTGHLVGKEVKKAQPDLPWTVDIGDPFSFGHPPWNNTSLYKKLNHRSESNVLEAADNISVTVVACKKIYSELFPGIEDKITVIPPLFSGTGLSVHEKTESKKGCRLVFTGSLYKEIRNPAYLLELLSGVFKKAPETSAFFYGRMNDCEDLFEPYLKNFPKNLFVHGLVSREMAANAVHQADILMNIANRTRYQLPSKLVDYMASGKPVLNIVSIEDDNSVSFLSSYPMAATFMERPFGNIKDDVERVFDFITNSEMISQQETGRIIQPYLIPAVETQYQNIIYQAETKSVSPKMHRNAFLQARNKSDEAMQDQQAKNKLWWELMPMTYVGWQEDDRTLGSLAEFIKMEKTLLSASPFLREKFKYSELKGKRVLDLGCGAGVLSCLLAKHGAITTAIDLTKNGTQLTTINATLQGLSIDVVNCDAENMPFADSSFDYIFTWGVIHHSRSTETVIGEISRLLMPDGSGIAMVYHRSSFVYYLKGLWMLLVRGRIFAGDTLETAQRYYVDGFYHRHFTKLELKNCLGNANLETTEIFATQQQENILPLLPQMLDNFLKLKFGWYLIAKFTKK